MTHPKSLVVIGASLGGMHALAKLLGALPRGFPLPIVIVQHRAADSESMFDKFLEQHTGREICEVQDKENLKPGGIYLAPADYHVLVDGSCLTLSTEAPVHYARPSIDVLFESAAEAFGAGVIGIVLTGANEDGARGAARVKACGGRVIVQEPATAENPVMPRAALEATAVDGVLPVEEIAPWLVKQLESQSEPSGARHGQ